MKRLMPSSLITFLQNNRNCLRADLFAITLPTGTTFYATDGQFGITVPSGTPGWSGATTQFHATDYGVWTRGAITAEAAFKMKAGTMSLRCVTQQTTQYPGLSCGLLFAALNGLFDAATIFVYTAYMPMGSYGNVSNGIETKFQGTITKLASIDRLTANFQCGDPIYLLNMKIPSRTFQPMCPWSIGDTNCTLNLAGTDINGYQMTQAFTASGASTKWVLTPVSAFTQPATYFAQGVVTCTAGANKGLSQTVKAHASGNLQTMNPWLFPVSPGDTFSVIVGCDHTLPTCIKKQGNQINFGGTPFVPPSSAAI